MKISREDVLRVAELAHLELSPEEIDTYRGQLDEILSYIDKLKELDVTGVEPMAQVHFDAGETATLRADVPVPPLGNAAALANAPQSGAGYFKVPKIIER